jgi:carbamoyltransferase
MTAILGISACYHDSAAALVRDGRIVAAAQEERFSRTKHDSSFPAAAIAYCLREAGIGAEEIDHIAFYEKPLTRFERILETFLASAPRGFDVFRRAMPVWLNDKLRLRARIREQFGRRRSPILFLDHHESHAASAFFPSPYEQAAILPVDGVGEWSTTALGVGAGNRIRLTQHLRFPHSLGLLYSAFTAYCGFAVNDGEYKLMGLAPYGQPTFAEDIRRHLIDLKSDGSFRLNLDYFHFGDALTMTTRRFQRRVVGPPRRPDAPLEQRHMDLAASVQKVLEEALLRIAVELHRRTRQDNLVLAGGVALNCVANGRLLREGPFPRSGYSPRRAMPAGRSARRCSWGISCFVSRGCRNRTTPSRAASWGLASRPRRSSASWKTTASRTAASATRNASPRRRRRSMGGRWSAGFRGGWSLDRGRSVRGASWPTPAARTWLHSSINRSSFARAFAPSLPPSSPSTRRRGSRARSAPTCCSSPGCENSIASRSRPSKPGS